MKYLLFVPIVFISGCMWQSVDQYDIQRAISYCGAVEKIVRIDSDAFGIETAMCTDKPMRSLTEVQVE